MLINSAPSCQISVVGTLLPRARENCSVEMLLHLEHSRQSGHLEVYSSGTKESADDKYRVGPGRVLKKIIGPLGFCCLRDKGRRMLS